MDLKQEAYDLLAHIGADINDDTIQTTMTVLETVLHQGRLEGAELVRDRCYSITIQKYDEALFKSAEEIETLNLSEVVKEMEEKE